MHYDFTSVALHEAEIIADGVYWPSGILSRKDGGGLITEGVDNVDINTETIDGKETLHSWARVKFQWQKRGALVQCCITVIRRQHKSLPMTDKTESLMKCDEFEKPKLRPEPPGDENAVEIVEADQTSFKKTRDTGWIQLCLFSQNVLPFPECSDIAGQSVLFWTGFNSLLAKEDPIGAYTAVEYPSVIDAKQRDVSTIFTTMNISKEE